jgi:hypothetical protein
MMRAIYILLLVIANSPWIALLAQEKTFVAPMGVDIHVRIDLPVTLEGNHRVQPPRVLNAPDPVMPKGGKEGTVIIKCIVGKDGRVHDPVVINRCRP